MWSVMSWIGRSRVTFTSSSWPLDRVATSLDRVATLLDTVAILDRVATSMDRVAILARVATTVLHKRQKKCTNKK